MLKELGSFTVKVVSCLTKVTKSVWAGLLLCVIHYSIARVRLPVHKANLDIVVNTQFLWSRSTCKYLVQSYLICSSSLAYNLNSLLLNKHRSLPLCIECTYDLNRYFETTCPRGSVERTRQFYGQVVSCLTKVTKSVWAGLLLCVIHYSIARVRLPVHKANLDIVVNTQFLWSRSTCKYLVQSYLICSSSLAYNLNNVSKRSVHGKQSPMGWLHLMCTLSSSHLAARLGAVVTGLAWGKPWI